MTARPLPTFRDPDGSLVLHDDQAVRSVHASARAAVLEFIHSSLSLRLQHRGDMVGISVREAPVSTDSASLELLHPLIPTPTYPWEWTPSQWLAAAELTLRLCEEALDEGWILKDATPLNILFLGTRPVLVDVLSFERRKPGASIWLAYGQYVRTFLLPLLTHRMLGWPLALMLFRRDGYEPAEVYSELTWPQRLSPAAFWPVTLPTWLERRNPDAPPASTVPKLIDDEAAVHILKRTLASLRTRTHRTVSQPAVSQWSEYAHTLRHYTAEDSRHKRDCVTRILTAAQPRRVLDVGANTGEYSFLAAELGIPVVALERDPCAAETLFRVAQKSQLPVLTVQADLARPTPAAGWENRESQALLPRLEAGFDCVMLLAVIHHLLLLEQIPLRSILVLCRRLTTAHLLVEWVPVTDPMFQSLLRGRDHLYGTLTEADLLTAARGLFRVVEREPLANGRILFFFEIVDEEVPSSSNA